MLLIVLYKPKYIHTNMIHVFNNMVILKSKSIYQYRIIIYNDMPNCKSGMNVLINAHLLIIQDTITLKQIIIDELFSTFNEN